MSYKIESKDRFLHVKYLGDLFDAAALKELGTLLEGKPKAHVVVNLLSVEEFDSTEPLQDFQADRMEQNLTCVLVVREAVLYLFDEEAPAVPTYQEGVDFFEMEDLQRTLLEE
ncbi:MAG: hypothetical protein NWS18_06005 [Schleiferiaceae bacterium]|jgi:hypothetical protein|nr:hypothetical protein [Schleiferiaceae bacterium]MDP4627637.1 hypothetical protein [Schleiferiaceae bacterium]MDP4728123.1 hypothetical protein [Schleiferiaceae bacterium]MDP4750199.1 hypothetical protein [Schleiferiaceae bacterium]MDP4900696.1 hypothetical protein [Schleiferiaceae bacterium]